MWYLSAIPKILHCYWGGRKLSYLRYLTLASFKQLNPDWQIILYKPLIPELTYHWKSGEQNYTDNFVDCWRRVEKLGITIKEIDFSKIGFINNASEVHKSDYLRWKLLYEVGGLWSDMDILFIKPMDSLVFNKLENKEVNAVYCNNPNYGHSIGFLMGSKGSEYFKTIHYASLKEYKKEGYQCMGSILCTKLFPTVDSTYKIGIIPYNLPMDIVYAHDATCVKELFDNKLKIRITSNTIGIHWYGGHELSGKYLNDTNGGLHSEGYSLIDSYIKQTKANIIANTPKKPLTLSIVMAFYNRQELLDKTLESLERSTVKDYELIIVDDASAVPLVCPKAKIIRVEKKDKWYNCSAIAWNMGMRQATGDVILLQSPECYHVGDVLAYALNNIKPNLYLSFGCYSINKVETEELRKGKFPVLVNALVDGHTGWYNHTKYRPCAYHFCSAILRNDLDIIGGFDERYAYGVAFDDDEFIRVIRYIGMDVKIIDSPYVIHQFHTHFEFESISAWREPHALNELIYNQGYNPNIHRDYGRNSEPFDPIKFKEDIARIRAQAQTKPKESINHKKKLSTKENRLVLESFLKKFGGA